MKRHRWSQGVAAPAVCQDCGTPFTDTTYASECPYGIPPSRPIIPPKKDTPTLAEIAASLRRIESMITELAAVMLSK